MLTHSTMPEALRMHLGDSVRHTKYLSSFALSSMTVDVTVCFCSNKNNSETIMKYIYCMNLIPPQCGALAVGAGTAFSGVLTAVLRVSRTPDLPATQHTSPSSNYLPSSTYQFVASSLQVGQMLSYSENEMIFHQSGLI